MIELDDSEIIPTATLVVTFADRVERWGPSTLGFAELVLAGLQSDPPEGFLSAAIDASSLDAALAADEGVTNE
jgi:hypothetical protein